ncbi:MAG: glucosaminidase domain-containing protein [Bacteroidales bacterium]|nr:glucosaminidase domain-containing protein [Bacteroidales bacterium]
MHRILLSLLFCIPLSICAQLDAYRQYIETYKGIAIENMQRYRIPASITLAQGLHESAAGRSYLATAANNHFGIKVGSSWTGPYVLRTDDAPNEQFRKYNSPAESYRDHAEFLSKRSRYAQLFTLPIEDYAAWARGLKAAGYATNPRYAEILINTIERYNLQQYDRPSQQRIAHQREAAATGRSLYLCNDLVYLIARRGDSFESIANDLGMNPKRLRKFNEVDQLYSLSEGDVVYLAKKKRRVARPIRHTYHLVQVGESMYSIAQRYGIRLDRLYRWNRLKADYSATAGDKLLLK